jgi:glycosyltransferase involved in cell wall biosynthesis
VKDQATLIQAFFELFGKANAQERERLRLVMVGDGPLMAELRREVDGRGLTCVTWLPGERNDVAELMRAFDVFVLPSLGEGISNTILEAMASGLPTVATDVGGNRELVREGHTGALVPPRAPQQMTLAIGRYMTNPEVCRLHGAAARRVAETEFGLQRMIDTYLAVYDELLAEHCNA